VLNDGETFTSIEGCRIVDMGETDLDEPMYDVIVRNKYYDAVEVLDVFRVYQAIEGSGA
jgi:hypothetical protein